MKHIFRTVLVAALCLMAFAQMPARAADAPAAAPKTMTYKTPEGTMKVEFCTPDMFRVRRSRSNAFEADEPWMVIKYNWANVPVKESQEDGKTILTTSALKIAIDKSNYAIEVFDLDGKSLYKETGAPHFEDAKAIINHVEMDPREHFFGFGERMDFLDQRGKRVSLNVGLGFGPKPAVGGKDILRANYCPVPFFMSTKGYGIFFHNAFPNVWDMGWTNTEEYSFEATGGELDYYFFKGDFYKILDLYTDLTGKSPMMPEYAFGLHLGSYSGGTWNNEQYTSDMYPVQLAKKMRDNKIPFDVLWLDSTWRYFNTERVPGQPGGFGNGGATFEWRPTFKDPKYMFDRVYDYNVAAFGLHIRSILDNGPELKILDKALAHGGVVYPGMESGGIVNFFDKKAVDWWWDNAAKLVVDKGCMFFKTDVGSAFGMRFYRGAEFGPQQEFKVGEEPERLHNVFPIAYAKAPYEKFAQHNKARGFNQTREGYAGIQRYPYIWAGDWGSEWQWFEPVVRGGLNLALSGVTYWAHNMGGFEQYSAYDTELYVRWCEFGLFTPMATLFGMDHPRYHEPWTYGEEAMAIFRQYDNLRYRLIPYIYSASYDLWKSARPIMTPLVMDYPEDENTYQICDQYMYGGDMMVCPVVTKNALSRPVYFPGGDWIDYWTGERISGRQYKSFLSPWEIMPIFIKAGAIIPMQEERQYYNEKPRDLITLDVYPAGESSYKLYEDDGMSMEYEKGICAWTEFKSALSDGSWKMTMGKTTGKYTPVKRNYVLKAFLDKAPTAVTENGAPVTKLDSAEAVQAGEGWFYDAEAHRLWVRTRGNNSADIDVVARF